MYKQLSNRERAMSYIIVITGELNPGATHDAVVNNLASLFKKDTSFVEKFFSGKPTTIRRDLNLETAKKYQTAISKAGCIAKIVEQEAIIDVPAQSDNSEASFANLSMAEVGVTIIEHIMPDEPQIDISDLSMSEAGEQLINPVAVQPAEIDTSNIELSPGGVVLSDETIPESPEIDTSMLSMADAGSPVTDTGK